MRERVWICVKITVRVGKQWPARSQWFRSADILSVATFSYIFIHQWDFFVPSFFSFHIFLEQRKTNKRAIIKRSPRRAVAMSIRGILWRHTFNLKKINWENILQELNNTTVVWQINLMRPGLLKTWKESLSNHCQEQYGAFAPSWKFHTINSIQTTRCH